MFKAAGPLWAQATAGDNAFTKLVQAGKKVLRKVFHKDVGPVKGTELPKPSWSLSAKPIQLTETANRKLIGGLFPKQIWSTQAAEIRRRAALRLICNSRKVPVFAFVGLSLGASLERKGETNDDVLCAGIRGLFQQYEAKSSQFVVKDQQFSLQSLELGKLIGKGCNAAVYEARPAVVNDAPQTDEETSESQSNTNSTQGDRDNEVTSEITSEPDMTAVVEDATPATAFGASPENFHSATSEDSPPVLDTNIPPAFGLTDNIPPAFGLTDDDDFSIIDEEADEQNSDDNLQGWVFYRVSSPRTSADSDTFSDSDSDIFILAADEDAIKPIPETLDDDDDADGGWHILLQQAPEGSGVVSIDVGVETDSGSSERVDDTSSSFLSSESSHDEDMLSNISGMADDLEPAPNIGEDYPLAVKMMFNYSVESRADRIMSAMAKETVPAPSCPGEQALGQSSPYAEKKHLPPHPNIVTMHGSFVDQTPRMPGDSDEYPSALPTRLHKEGLGRNSTLFLVMKKYPMTLREFLAGNEVSMETRCRLLAQLLEGVTHLGNHEIAHRDLKSDNILIDLTHGKDQPLLAISDFGCCLADVTHGLKIPYTTGEVDKGGNCALMAPEIKCAEPGARAVLDYSSADMWAAGALAYEIFGLSNPFYGDRDARDYEETDLPDLPADVPETVQKLVELMLQRDPHQRPSPSAAATTMQLFLWSPAKLQPFQQTSPSGQDKSQKLWQYKELCDWLEQLAVEAVCRRVFRHNGPPVDTLLKQLFLSRVTREDILAVVDFV